MQQISIESLLPDRPTTDEIAGRTLAFSRAIRAVDPSAKLIATGGDPDWFSSWNERQLSDPAGTFDYLSTHFVVANTQTKLPHASTDFMTQVAFALPVELGRKLRADQQQIDQHAAFANRAHVAFTEWLFIGRRDGVPSFRNMGGAVDTAGFFNMLMRNADIVPISDITGIMEFAGIWKKRYPANADAWTLLGVARAQQNEPAKSEDCFHKALAIDPHLASAETNLGHLLLDQHRPSEALPYLADALRSSRDNKQLRDMLVSAAEETALQQRANGDRNGALATLLSAKSEAPHTFPLLVDLGILEDELRLLHDADRDVHEARLLHPEDLKALYAEARVKMDLQDMPTAEQDMRAYLKARPDDATAHYGLGRVLQMTQQSNAAKAEFERSIALAPGQAESYYQIGQMALDHGNYTEAQQECRKALEHDPRHGGALTALGIAAFRLKQYEDAVRSLQAAIAVAPGYQPAHYYYGLALAKTGQKEASERELKVAAQMADEQNRREAQHLQLAPGVSSPLPQP